MSELREWWRVEGVETKWFDSEEDAHFYAGWSAEREPTFTYHFVEAKALEELRECSNNKFDEIQRLKAELAKYRKSELEAAPALHAFVKEREELQYEIKKLKRERHDIKCPFCHQNFWFTKWGEKYPNNLSVVCSHLVAARILKEALDWYWKHWGTNDPEIKAKGYLVSQEAIDRANIANTGK